jgi:hypothetical protein
VTRTVTVLAFGFHRRNEHAVQPLRGNTHRKHVEGDLQQRQKKDRFASE